MARSNNDIPSAQDVADSLDWQQGRIFHRMFRRAGVRAPLVIWEPTDPDLHHPMMKSFASLCREHAGADGALPADIVWTDRFEAFHEWMIIVDCEDDGASFRCRHYGRGIAEAYGRDMQGATYSELDGPVALFLSAIYRAVRQRVRWVLTEHEPPEPAFVSLWRRLVVPLAAPADGTVQGYVVLSLPENELGAGLSVVPDPVFVVDADLSICFANKAAQDLFGRIPMSANGMPFAKVTGVDLKPRKTPIQMIASRAMHDEVTLSLRDTLLAEFEITVSGAMLRSHAYYIVVMRVKLG